MERVPSSSISSVASESDTLSEFLAKRYHGSVPVLGGNPTVGAREFGNAASADIVRAVSGLTNVLYRFSGMQSPRDDNSGPITMLDLSDEITSIDDACKLDSSKIEILLSTSMIDPRDTKRYSALLATARTSLIRKRDAMVLQHQRKHVRTTANPVARLSDLQFDELARSRLKTLYGVFDISHDHNFDDDYNRMLLMAITHDSCFEGRETNRVLAHVGDSAMKIVTARYCYTKGRPVSDISDFVQANQSDAVLTEFARQRGLSSLTYVGRGVDPGAKKIQSTVVEAVLGAVYCCEGEDVVASMISGTGIMQLSDNTPVIG